MCRNCLHADQIDARHIRDSVAHCCGRRGGHAHMNSSHGGLSRHSNAQAAGKSHAAEWGKAPGVTKRTAQRRTQGRQALGEGTGDLRRKRLHGRDVNHLEVVGLRHQDRNGITSHTQTVHVPIRQHRGLDTENPRAVQAATQLRLQCIAIPFAGQLGGTSVLQPGVPGWCRRPCWRRSRAAPPAWRCWFFRRR